MKALRAYLARHADVLMPVVVASTLMAVRIHDRHLWSDEVASVRFSRLPFARLVKVITHDEANMSAYYVGLHIWAKLSMNETWTRGLSALGGIVSVALTVLLVKRYFARRTALLAGFILALHPMFLAYLTEARAYSWAMAAGLGATLAIDPSGTQLRPVAYGLLTGVGFLLNAPNALLLFAHIAAFIVCGAPRALWRQMLLAAAIAGAVGSMAVPALLRNRSTQVNWIHHITPVRFLAATKDLMGGPTLACVSFLVVGWTLLKAARQWNLVDFRIILPLSSVVVPIASLAVVSLVKPLYVDRFLIYVVPFVAILIAHTVCAADVPWRTGAYIATAALVVLPQGDITKDRTRVDDPESAANYVRSDLPDGTVVQFRGLPDVPRLAVEFYLEGSGSRIVSLKPADSVQAGWFVGGPHELGERGKCFGSICVTHISPIG